MTRKTCSSCDIEKELEEFPKGLKYKDGRRGVCKLCDKKYTRKYKVREGDYKCVVCQVTKPQTDFNTCHENKNGLRNTCKKCTPNRNIRNRSAEFMQRYFNNVNMRIGHCLRTRIRHAVNSQNVSKANKTPELMGCPVADLKTHLESKFAEGMTWENYGQWHIDHIRPCASFDLEDPEEQKKCFHWSNLQPLWAVDNLKKSDKWQEA